MTKANAKIPMIIRDMLEHHSFLKSEDPQDYYKIFGAIADDIEPCNIIEWLWANDISYYVWEIRRLRSFKTQIVEISRRSRAKKEATEAYRKEWAARQGSWLGDALFKSHVINENKLRQLTPELKTDSDSAQALVDALDVVEKVDSLLASAERRLNNTLREIELRRETLARRLRDISGKLIEGKETKTPGA